MVDIVERLHYAGYNDARLGEAAAEIERLRSAVNEHRNAAMEADLRTQAAVRSEHKQRTALQRITELARKEQIGKSDRLMFILECTKKALTP